MTVLDQASPKQGRRQAPLRVLVTGVASDSHTWNLIYLQLALEERGHEVTNVGPCVGVDLLVDQCQQFVPDLVVMSSVNGHGHTDGLRAVRRLRQSPETASLPVVIGGKLGIDDDDAAGRAELLAAGFDAVFGDADLGRFFGFVQALSPVGVR